MRHHSRWAPDYGRLDAAQYTSSDSRSAFAERGPGGRRESSGASRRASFPAGRFRPPIRPDIRRRECLDDSRAHTSSWRHYNGSDMPANDAQRIWFPEMVERLRSRWQEGTSLEALIELRDELDAMLGPGIKNRP